VTLSRFDDYCIHQTPEPVAHPASSDRNVYDRYWFNGYANDGEFYFGIALGLYPHLRVMDCGFSLVQGGEQHAFHGSRRAPLDPSESAVGPFKIDVVEPMRRIRVTLAENETGLSCDLLFTARTASVEEGRQTLHREGRVFMDATRFAQFGQWEGEIRCAGRTTTIDPARVMGTKDRSWGIRPVGERDPGGAPSTEPPQFFFLWSPIHWDDHCTHFGIFEHADGTPWHRDGAIVPAYSTPDAIPGVEDPALERMVSVEHDVTYVPGTRRAAAAKIALIARDGRRRDIELEPLLRFQMKGIGYTNFEWGHGAWKGDLAIGGESFKSDELDPLAPDNLHIQQVMRARSEGREGIGVLEQIAIGPHTPSGFKQLLDGAT